MKFYLIEIVTDDTGKVSPAVYPYDNFEDAEATFHTKLGGAMKSKAYAKVQLMVINSENGVYPNLQSTWTRKEPETVATK